MFCNRMIVSYRASEGAVRGLQRNDCWAVQYLVTSWRNVSGRMIRRTVHGPQREESYVRICRIRIPHSVQNTLDSEWLVTLYLPRLSRYHIVGTANSLRTGRFGVRIQAVSVDFSFLQSLSIALGPIQPHIRFVLGYLKWQGRDADVINLVPRRRKSEVIPRLLLYAVMAGTTT